MMIRLKLITIVLLLLSANFSAQEKASLQLVKEVRTDAICLRWAVDTPLAWHKSNTIGFRLERFTILRDGKMLSTPERTDLGTFVVPQLEAWQSLAEQNDNAAIVAQAIYGEDFQVEMSANQSPIQGIVNQSQEMEQRFSFALMAADLDFEVAQFAGWGYIDKQVKKNEEYFYKIHLLPSPKLTLQAGSVMASLNQYEPLPSPLDFNAFFQDRKVLLTWDYKTLSHWYSYYFLEKAQANSSFEPIGQLPVVNMNPNTDSPSMLYIDSLSQNDKEFSYRLRGKTIFGTYSPYTEVISGKGVKALSVTAQLSNIQAITDNQYRIGWNFPTQNQNEITHFALLHSTNDQEYRIIKDNISVTDRMLTTSVTNASNYYKIRTFGTDGSHQDSFAMLVQPQDNTPPDAVQYLRGEIDTLGIVHLQWSPNTEADLMGYYVFRANQKAEEMMRITGKHITHTHFTDTLSLKNLNEKVFYSLTAIDFRKNESSHSETLELTKPDRIPPMPPLFTAYTQEKNHWRITWQKSLDQDVSQYHLYRKEKHATQWHKIHSEKHTNEHSYTYKEPATLSGTFVYTLRAEDKSGNWSEYAPVIHIHHSPVTDTNVLRGLNSRVEQHKIILGWDKLKVAISEIVIYKAIKGEKPTLWRSFSQAVNLVEDTDITPDTTYQYLIKVILQDHSPTPTQKIEVWVKDTAI